MYGGFQWNPGQSISSPQYIPLAWYLICGENNVMRLIEQVFIFIVPVLLYPVPCVVYSAHIHTHTLSLPGKQCDLVVSWWKALDASKMFICEKIPKLDVIPPLKWAAFQGYLVTPYGVGYRNLIEIRKIPQAFQKQSSFLSSQKNFFCGTHFLSFQFSFTSLCSFCVGGKIFIFHTRFFFGANSLIFTKIDR